MKAGYPIEIDFEAFQAFRASPDAGKNPAELSESGSSGNEGADADGNGEGEVASSPSKRARGSSSPGAAGSSSGVHVAGAYAFQSGSPKGTWYTSWFGS